MASSSSSSTGTPRPAGDPARAARTPADHRAPPTRRGTCAESMQPDSALVERGRSRETAKRSDLGRSARFPGGSAKIQIGPDGMACRNDPGVVIRKDHGEAAVPQPLDDVGRRAVVVRNSDDEPYPLDAVLDQQPVPYVCSHG